MTALEQREAARQFYYTWHGRGDEKSDAQSFWLQLLTDVLGMDDTTNRIVFEKRVLVDGQTKYIDAYIPESRVHGSTEHSEAVAVSEGLCSAN